MSCSNYNPKNRTYPCVFKTYRKCVGKLLPNIIGSIFRELGFKAVVNHQQRNGVDVEVFDWDRRIMVLEILNWNIGSRLYLNRKNSIISNLMSHPNCIKALVHTQRLPSSYIKELNKNGIFSIFIGYQVVYPICYNFFKSKATASARRPYSAVVKSHIKSKIFNLLCKPVILI